MRSFRLLRCRSSSLGCLLSVASDHDHGKECAHDCRTEKGENDGNPDCPNARGKEALKRMVIVDEWLVSCSVDELHVWHGASYHE